MPLSKTTQITTPDTYMRMYKLAGWFWALLAFASYAVTWMDYVPDPGWLVSKLRDGAWIPYAHLMVFFLSLFCLNHFVASARKRSSLLLLFFIVSFFSLVMLAGDRSTALSIVLCAAWIYSAGLSLKITISSFSTQSITFYAATALALVLLEGVLFSAGIIGMSSYGLKLALGVLFLAPAGAALGMRLTQKQLLSTELLDDIPIVGWVFAEALFLVFCFGFIHAYAPETLVDATALHIPKAASIAGSESLNVITDFPYNSFTLMSPYVHLDYGFMYTFAGEYGIKALTWSLVAIMAGAIIGLCRSMKTSLSLSIAAAALYLLMPAYIWHFGSGYLDMTAAALGLSGAALLLSQLDMEPKNHFNLFIAGALLGAATAAKLTYLVYGASFFVAVVGVFAFMRKERRLEPVIHFSGAIAAGAVLVCAPHFIYEYFITGNPVYPALNRLFESPYWNIELGAGVIQHFADFGLREWLMFPYILSVHTSLAGSSVEYSDGAGGAWLLLFFPLILVALVAGRKDKIVMATAIGSFLYIFLLAVMGTVYIRYYMPVIPLLFCLMARGGFLFFPKNIFSENMRNAVVPVVLVGLSLPQLIFPTVWSPTLSHWNYYLRGNRIDWLDQHYSGLKGFQKYVAALPEETRVFVFHSDFVSHIPRTSVYFRPADILFSGLLANNLSKEDKEELNSDFWGFLQHFKSGERMENIDYRKLDRIICEYGDILIFNRLEMIDFMKPSALTSVERLAYTSIREPGPHIRFIVTYDAHRYDTEHKNICKQISADDWAFMNLDGETSAPDNQKERWATNERYFYQDVKVPEKASRLKFALNLIYDTDPDYSVGVQINWMRDDGSLITSLPFGLFYSKNRAAVYAVEQVPAGAKRVAFIVRPNKEKLIGVDPLELCFDSGKPYHSDTD